MLSLFPPSVSERSLSYNSELSYATTFWQGNRIVQRHSCAFTLIVLPAKPLDASKDWKKQKTKSMSMYDRQDGEKGRHKNKEIFTFIKSHIDRGQ